MTKIQDIQIDDEKKTGELEEKKKEFKRVKIVNGKMDKLTR